MGLLPLYPYDVCDLLRLLFVSILAGMRKQNKKIEGIGHDEGSTLTVDELALQTHCEADGSFMVTRQLGHGAGAFTKNPFVKTSIIRMGTTVDAATVLEMVWSEFPRVRQWANIQKYGCRGWQHMEETDNFYVEQGIYQIDARTCVQVEARILKSDLSAPFFENVLDTLHYGEGHGAPGPDEISDTEESIPDSEI